MVIKESLVSTADAVSKLDYPINMTVNKMSPVYYTYIKIYIYLNMINIIAVGFLSINTGFRRSILGPT